jgi:hypothetical protein
MLCYGEVKDPKGQMVRFYGGLRREIQDIVHYKEYHSIQHLFHFICWHKKNCKVANSGGAAPSRPDSLRRQPRRHPLRAYVRRRLPPPAAHTAPHLRHYRDAKTTSPWCLRVLQKNLLHPPLPQGHSSDIKCHRCQGLDHMQQDCHSKRAYIHTSDGGCWGPSSSEGPQKHD